MLVPEGLGGPHSWASQTGYDPRGSAANGWGCSPATPRKKSPPLPHLAREQLLGYLDQVYDAAREYVAGTPIETLLMPSRRV